MFPYHPILKHVEQQQQQQQQKGMTARYTSVKYRSVIFINITAQQQQARKDCTYLYIYIPRTWRCDALAVVTSFNSSSLNCVAHVCASCVVSFLRTIIIHIYMRFELQQSSGSATCLFASVLSHNATYHYTYMWLPIYFP